MVNKKNNQALLIKLAQYYFIDGLTQGQIAKQVGLSRPTIVRLLKQAREDGLIEIRLTQPLPQTTLLETKIEKIFLNDGLNEVIVTEVSNVSPKETVAKAASGYLKRVLRSHHVLGVGWSTTLSYVPAYFSLGQYSPKGIVQLVGSANTMSGANAYEIAIKLGSAYGAPVEHMPSPAIVESKEMRDALMRNSSIQRTMASAEKCNIAMVGIGGVSDYSTMVQVDYLKPQDLKDIVLEENGVGDILAHYYDINGNEIRSPWQNRIMGIDLEQLRGIENVVGVAAGEEKALAVLGALRGRFINTLIIDMPLAKALLAYIEED